MVPRSASAPALLVLTALALVVGACAGASAPIPSSPATAAPGSSSPVAHGPVPTPVTGELPVVTPSVKPVPTPADTPIIGDVDGALGGPALTIVQVDADTIVASLDDKAAKAWRLVVSGVGDRGGDRWEILVETGDVAPVITATEVRDNAIVDVMDLTGFGDGTAAAGGCHSTLPVCLDSEGFTIPDNGDGHFSVRFDLPQAQVALLVRGGTATWDGEPFVLGPWHDTEAFPWGEG